MFKYIRHQAFYFPSLILLLGLLVSFLTRAVLMMLAWKQLDHGAITLFSIFLKGFAADTAFYLALAGVALMFSALLHTRFADSSIFRGKRAIGVFMFCAFLIFVAVSEFVFWNEFESRFNFIAVDYLIYTHEVIGNIRESYPMPLILSGLFLSAGLLAWGVLRYWKLQGADSFSIPQRFAFAVIGALSAFFVGGWAMDMAASGEKNNALVYELSRNGPASFLQAARDNDLDFKRFYASLSEQQMQRYAPLWPDPKRDLPSSAPLHPEHIVLIEMESMSASFMRSYGSEKTITPHLDALMKQGVWFTHLYATGTRTVRGLEAMSAALPPLPGQSIVHRPNSKNIVTLGGVLAEHDYAPMFMYGGYGAFDNMNSYFSSNGYAINDRSNFKKENTSFATVWGVADEMLFNEALDQLDKDSRQKQRRFLHIMTTSNHRPYVYPEGRIDIPSKTGRDGAVKYTDWAIHQFLQKASSKPWFDKTLFVIVADHNASVAGKQSLPPNQYLIPALLYAPKMLQPRTIDTMSSQIDLPPTLLALLGIRHQGVFFGEDLLAHDVEPRAFLVNYQELGRLTPAQNGQRDLVMLGPKRRVEEFDVDMNGDQHRKALSAELSNTAIAVFQKTDEVYSSGHYHLNDLTAAH